MSDAQNTMIVTSTELSRIRLLENFCPVELYAGLAPMPGEVGRLVARMEIDYLASGVKVIRRSGTLGTFVEASHE